MWERTLHLVVALALILRAANAATITLPADTLSEKCLLIKPEWRYCRGLAGQYIDTTLVNGNMLYSLLLKRGMNEGSLSMTQVLHNRYQDFLNASLIEMPNLDVKLNTYRGYMQGKLGCTGFNFQTRRYLVALTCIDLVQDSQTNCKLADAQPFKPMCKDSCEKSVQSLEATFKDSVQCPKNPHDSPLLADTVNNMIQICTQAGYERIQGAAGSCISGDEIDAPTCGYPNYKQFCNSKLCSTGATELADVCKAAKAAEDELQGADGGKVRGLTAPGIAGIVLGCALVLLLCAYFFMRRRKAAKQDNRTSIQFGDLNKSNTDMSLSRRNSTTDRPGQGNSMVMTSLNSSYTNMFDDQAPLKSSLSESNDSMHPQRPKAEQSRGLYAVNRNEDDADGSPQGLNTSEYGSSRAPGASGSPKLKSPNMNHANKRVSSLVVDHSKFSIMTSAYGASQYGETSEYNADTIKSIRRPGDDGRLTMDLEDQPELDGEQYKATRNYEPVMNDEMELVEGDVVLVTQNYDDGWGYGLNLSTGQLGVLPLNYVTLMQDVDMENIAIRNSTYADHQRLSNYRQSIAASTAYGGYSRKSSIGGSAPQIPPFLPREHAQAPLQQQDLHSGLVGESRVSVSAAKAKAQSTYNRDSINTEDLAYEYDLALEQQQQLNQEPQKGQSSTNQGFKPLVMPQLNSSGPSNSQGTGAESGSESNNINALMQALDRIAYDDRSTTAPAEDATAYKATNKSALRSKISMLAPSIRDSIATEAQANPSRFSFSALMSVLDDPQLQYNQSVYSDRKQSYPAPSGYDDRDTMYSMYTQDGPRGALNGDAGEYMSSGIDSLYSDLQRPQSSMSDVDKLGDHLHAETEDMRRELQRLQDKRL